MSVSPHRVLASIAARFGDARARHQPNTRGNTSLPTTGAHRKTVDLIFQQNQLIDADDRLWHILPDQTETHSWASVRRCLRGIVPDLPETLTESCHQSPETGVTCDITKNTAGFRLSLHPPEPADIDWFAAKCAQVISQHMSDAVIYAPDLIWHQDQEGAFLWGNTAFDAYAQRFGDPQRLVDHIADITGAGAPRRTTRVSLTPPDHQEAQAQCFEITRQDSPTGQFFFARDIDDMVRAEAMQQNFVQTLSKTFANLTTGLAIFNRDQRLVLFNPALVDLSRVSIDFLSARPALFEFFDKLRESQIMPEPKNYSDWRDRMTALVAAARDDRFRETWTLANGQTFDITGQAYPDGAIAFLFNDITAEVSLTRGYRAELETLQSVIDTIEDAVAVFDTNGILTVCNTAYARLWDIDPDTCIPQTTIVDATQTWKNAFLPSPVWPDLRDFVTNQTERASWDSELRTKAGHGMLCQVDPICQGATLIRFCAKPVSCDTHPIETPLQIVSA